MASGENTKELPPEKLCEESEVLNEPKPCTAFKSTNDDPDALCGVGSWTPDCIQKAANLKLFLVLYSINGLSIGASFTYLIGCLSTMEKRYAYDTKKSGLILIAEELAPILFGVLIGYFGGLANRPVLLTFGMLTAAVSNFIMALPYFVYGPGGFDVSQNIPVSRISGAHAQFCDKRLNSSEESCKADAATTAVLIFALRNFLKGVSGVIYYTIGTSYVDDSIKKKNTPMYFGALFALRLLGPTLGFLLSSFCLQLYEDPFYDPGYDTGDPRWVGAWWLGFVILGTLIVFISLPMILFPRQFPKKNTPCSLLKKKQSPKSTFERLNEMGKALKRLIKNPILMCHYLGGVLRIIGVFGYYVMLPKYMEMQFRQSASKASLFSGPASIIGMQFGIFLGGVLIRKFRPRPRVLTGGIVITETFTILALTCCMLLTCSVSNIPGKKAAVDPLFDLKNECNANCKCTTEVFTPVCGPDGKTTYFSPCFAGCSDGDNKTAKEEVFTDCKCVYNEDGEFLIGDTNNGYCGFECQWIVTYVAILSLGKFMSSTASVGNALISLRCVDPEDKSIALGASTGIFSLLAFLPYPFIYGSLTDASCLVWEESCGKTGNCWVYDIDKFRYLLHGVSAAFVFMGCLPDVLIWILSPRLRNLYDDDDVEKEKPTEDLVESDIIDYVGVLGVVHTGLINGSILVQSLNDKTILRQ